MNPSTPTCTECEVRKWICARVVAALRAKGYPQDGMRFDQQFDLDTPTGEIIRIGIELVVCLEDRPALLVKCVAGNLVTRERAAVAVARLFFQPPVPLVIVANDTDAAVIDTRTGKTEGFGYASFPEIAAARERIETGAPVPLSVDRRERERRILGTYLNLGCSPPGEPF